MALPHEKLGRKYDGGTASIDPERSKAYALATNDDNPAYASGRYTPPVFGVVPTWGPMVAAMEDVIPAEAQKLVVHAERDMHFHKPLVPNMTLQSESEAFAWRVSASSTRYTIRIVSRDAGGDLVLDQYVTMFIQKMNDGASAGPDKPDHAFVESARANKVGEHVVPVDADQTYRYRDASGDNMRIHIDPEFAKKVGLPGIIVHGLCTMAMNSQSVIKLVAGGDPGRLSRLAVRWSKYVLPGSPLETVVYDAGQRGDTRLYCFESSSAGSLVVTNGWAEVRP